MHLQHMHIAPNVCMHAWCTYVLRTFIYMLYICNTQTHTCTHWKVGGMQLHTREPSWMNGVGGQSFFASGLPEWLPGNAYTYSPSSLSELCQKGLYGNRQRRITTVCFKVYRPTMLPEALYPHRTIGVMEIALIVVQHTRTSILEHCTQPLRAPEALYTMAVGDPPIIVEIRRKRWLKHRPQMYVWRKPAGQGPCDMGGQSDSQEAST